MIIRILFLVGLTIFFVACTAPVKKTEEPKPAVATPPPQKAVEVKPPEAPQFRVTCKVDGDERSIQIVKSQDRKVSSSTNVCEVVYTKNQDSQVVASSVANVSHCESIYARIKTNLENGGFKCQ